MSSAITATSSSTTTDSDPLVPSAGSQVLSQNDFLNLLVAQMKAQDPMNPQSDTQMAAQMAQFTSLQQASTMSTNIATMLTQQQISQANSMLGGTVTVQVDPKTIDSGVVQSVEFNGGSPKIIVNNKSYDLSQVLTLSPTVVTTIPTATGNDPLAPSSDRSSVTP